MDERAGAYVIGQIAVKEPGLWVEYCRQVPATLRACDGQLMFRARQASVLAGDNSYADVVVIRFPDLEKVNRWFASPAYQALIPLRDTAARVVLTAYETA